MPLRDRLIIRRFWYEILMDHFAHFTRRHGLMINNKDAAISLLKNTTIAGLPVLASPAHFNATVPM